jgi:Glycosyl transferase family 2
VSSAAGCGVAEAVQEQSADVADAVAMAYVHDGDEVTYSFHHSMVQLLDHDLADHARVWSGGLVSMRAGTDGLADARNRAVRDFLAEAKADWLWWVDTDMGFAPDTVDRLFAAADPTERPVVGALCFANREVDNDGMGGRRALAAPVIMHWTHEGDRAGFDTRWDYPADTVVRCDGIGSACVLVHRSVFERVLERFGEHWYTRARNPSTGELVSEDLSFCVRLMALEIPVHVHTGVKTTHAKRIWLSEEDYWAQRALNAPPPRPQGVPAVPPPARTWTVPRFAIVPTHNRPARLLALVVSLGAQVDHIVVLDNASSPPVDAEKLQASAPDRVTVTVIRDERQPPHLSRFWNIMLDACELSAGVGPWDVGVFNDDAVLPGGWFGVCADALREHPTALIAHTEPTSPALLVEPSNVVGNRMCPHAFVLRGEAGLRADEDMRWWYFDTDLDLRARASGGVLSVPGPRVVNAHANSSTRGVLAEQAAKDRAVFDAKWAMS